MSAAARAAALAVTVTLCWPLAARAAEPELAKHRRDLYLALGAGALWGGLELAKGSLAPDACRWCARNGLDDGVREKLVWSHPKAARLSSDVLASGLLPAAAAGYFLLSGRNGPGLREGAWDVVYVTEAAMLASSLTAVVKLFVARERPFLAHGNYPEPNYRPHPDDSLSFWSNHTALTFAIATSSGTIASMRGRSEAPWIWAIGITAASTAGYLRMAGDKHYLTDVLTGAVVGTAFGVAVPRLLHGKRGGPSGQGDGLTVVPTPFGIAGTF